MKRKLRLLILTLLTVVCSTAWGNKITFADLGLENGVQYTEPFDGGTFTVTFAGGQNDGKYYNTGSAIRVYGDGSMIVTAKSGNLAKIVVTFGTSNRPETADVVDTGTFDPATGIWTGNAPQVTFTRPTGSGHWRIEAVEAFLEGEDPDPGPGPGDEDAYSITFADLGLENGIQYTEPFDAGNFTVTFGEGGNNGKYYNTGSAIRIYGDGFMKVATKSANLAKIEVTFDRSGNFAPETSDVVDTGTFDPETGIWTGNAPQVTFTRPTGSGHWRIQKVAVNFDGEVKPMPTISGTTPFTQSTTVTITPSNEDFAVYYTTDGSDPKLDSHKVYNGPFTLTATTTVKAVEEDLEGNLSAVAEKTFVKEEIPDLPTAANIAAFKALEVGTEAILTLDGAQVVYAGTSDIYVRDASGAIDFYATGLNLTTGQMLSGSVIGKTAVYNDIPELAKTNNTNANNITTTAGTATPKVVSIAAAKSSQYYCDLVRLENVYVTAKEEGNFTNYYAYIGTDSVQIYDKFKVGLGNFNETDTYNVEGILVPWRGSYEVYLTQPLAGGGDSGLPQAANIAAFKALELNTEAELTLTNASVLFVGPNDVYVRDASGAIDFYKTGLNFVQGQVLNGKIIGKNAVYNDLPELTKTENTNANGYTSAAGSATPKVLGITAARSSQYYCDLIRLENVYVASKQDGQYTNYYAYIGTDSLQIYDRFNVGMGEFTETDTYTVEGILVPWKGDYELYLTKPLSSGGGSDIQICNSIAEFKAIEKNTDAKLLLNNAQVLYAYGRDVFVRDATGAIDLYNTGIEFATNQILNGSITGKLAYYMNLPELAKTDATTADDITFSEGTPAVPVNATIPQLLSDTYMCDLVRIDNVNIKTEEGKHYAYSGSDEIQVFDKFKIISEGTEWGNASYNVIGILVIYQTTYEIYPTVIATSDGIETATVTTTEGPAYNLAGQKVGDDYRGIVIQGGKKIIRK